MELIDFEGVASVGTFHQIAMLVDDSSATDFQQIFSLLARDFLLKFVARQSAINRFSLDGDESFVVAQSDAYRGRFAGDVVGRGYWRRLVA